MQRYSLLLLLAQGCIEDKPPTSTAVIDADGDGHSVEDGDCDDHEPLAHPGGAEVCDGIDNNCDGAVDEGLTGTWYEDVDGDGYGDASVEACTQPPGAVEDGGDCDDHEPLALPGGSEVCDGIDNNCDGAVDEGLTAAWYADGDGDGFGDPTQEQVACAQPSGHVLDASDCDDADASVFPGAEEVCEDGVVNDCGLLTADVSRLCFEGDFDLGDAHLTLLTDEHQDQSGHVVDSVGDLNGDGLADLLVTANNSDLGGENTGTVYLVLGGSSGSVSLADAHATILGDALGSTSGSAAQGVGDVDGDGVGDVLIGAPTHGGGGTYAGAAYLVSGSVSGTVSLADAHATFIGAAANDFAGDAVGAAGDVDGDGAADLLISAAGRGSYAGSTYLVLGPVSSGAGLDSAHATINGERSGDRSGGAVSGAGDVDGDGIDDVLIGAPSRSSESIFDGAAYLLMGPVSGEVDLEDADVKLAGSEAYENVGGAVSGAGDVDGDGLDDVLISAPQGAAGGVGSGQVYLMLGPVSGSAGLEDAHATLIGDALSRYAGSAVDGAGDVDGDGRDDVIIGSTWTDSGAGDAGAYLVLGGVSGGVSLAHAHVRMLREDNGDYAGRAVSAAGDVDGDGLSDLIIGAPADGTEGSDVGAYVLLGGRY